MLDPTIVAAKTHGPAFWVIAVLLGAERITPSSHGALTAVVMVDLFSIAV
jgi:hypothetical protein